MCRRSCFCANEEELLRELGVDHILNVAEECPPPPTVANRKEGEKLVKHYMMVDVVEHVRPRAHFTAECTAAHSRCTSFPSARRSARARINGIRSSHASILSTKPEWLTKGQTLTYRPHDSFCFKETWNLTHLFGRTGKTVAVRRDGAASG